MEFSSLVKAVQDFWNFIWPPVICLAIIYGIVIYIAPTSLQRIWAWLLAIHPAVGTQVTAWKAIKRYGFDKLIPYLAAFALIFALDAARNVVVIAGDLIPPRISYDPDRLLLYHGESVEIRALWYRLGSIENISEFRQAIGRTVSDARDTHKNSPELLGIDQWKFNESAAYAAFSACRFFLLLTLVLAVAEVLRTRRVWRVGLRSAVCASIFCVAGLVFCIRFVYAVEQEFYATNQAALVFAPKTPGCVMGPENMCPEYEEFLQANREHHTKGRWWFVAGSDGWYFRWLWEQIAGHR